MKCHFSEPVFYGYDGNPCDCARCDADRKSVISASLAEIYNDNKGGVMEPLKAKDCPMCGKPIRGEAAIPIIHVGLDGNWPPVSDDLVHFSCAAGGK